MSVDHGQIPITSPCPINLDRGGVSKEDRSMFCRHCVKDVHLLSTMSEPEARSFMRENEGRDICVSYAIRPDGRIRFRPELPEPALVPIQRLARNRAPQRQRLAQAASIGAAALLAACTAHSDPEPEPAKPVAPLVQRAEPVEPPAPVVEPCDPPGLDTLVAGGLVAERVEDVQVEGGIKPMPLPEPPTPTVTPKQPWKADMHARGGLRAARIPDPVDPAE
ncbi:hypothetical protein [Enhygromyxa salina]|nr:hypothetical protein [Enhygromyxa salina]